MVPLATTDPERGVPGHEVLSRRDKAMICIRSQVDKRRVVRGRRLAPSIESFRVRVRVPLH